MREIRPSSSEGGAGFNPLLLPLSPLQNRPLVGRVPSPGVPIWSILRIAEPLLACLEKPAGASLDLDIEPMVSNGNTL